MAEGGLVPTTLVVRGEERLSSGPPETVVYVSTMTLPGTVVEAARLRQGGAWEVVSTKSLESTTVCGEEREAEFGDECECVHEHGEGCGDEYADECCCVGFIFENVATSVATSVSVVLLTDVATATRTATAAVTTTVMETVTATASDGSVVVTPASGVGRSGLEGLDEGAVSGKLKDGSQQTRTPRDRPHRERPHSEHPSESSQSGKSGDEDGAQNGRPNGTGQQGTVGGTVQQGEPSPGGSRTNPLDGSEAQQPTVRPPDQVPTTLETVTREANVPGASSTSFVCAFTAGPGEKAPVL